MYLPGMRLKLIEGSQCCECDLAATHSIVGECDSFGSETMSFCDTHWEAFQKEEEESRQVKKTCDWCKTKAILSFMRDPDEGSYGPVYEVCQTCRDKVREQQRKELEEYESYS